MKRLGSWPSGGPESIRHFSGRRLFRALTFGCCVFQFAWCALLREPPSNSTAQFGFIDAREYNTDLKINLLDEGIDRYFRIRRMLLINDSTWWTICRQVEHPPLVEPRQEKTASEDDLIARLNRAEEALRTRELNFQLIVDSIPAQVAVITPTGEVETLNQACLKYLVRLSRS